MTGSCANGGGSNTPDARATGTAVSCGVTGPLTWQRPGALSMRTSGTL
jgi:hypothetical protein